MGINLIWIGLGLVMAILIAIGYGVYCLVMWLWGLIAG